MSFFSRKLKSLGFQSYEEYLASEHWKRFSARVRAKFCFCCGRDRRQLQVHHHTYDRLGEELDTDVATVCRPCHKKIHEMVKGRVSALEKAHLLLHSIFFPPRHVPKPQEISKNPDEKQILPRPWMYQEDRSIDRQIREVKKRIAQLTRQLHVLEQKKEQEAANSS